VEEWPIREPERLRFPDPFRNQRRTASPDGFSLHAGVRIHEHDREGLERLCRYAVRPPFALQRLSQGEDGQLVEASSGREARSASTWVAER
jgi:hypothetical protein